MFIVLGLITDVGTQVARGALTNRTTNALNVKTAAISQWNSAFTTLKTNMAQDSTTNCGQSLSCYTKADSHFAAAMTTFANQVQAITMPPAAAPDASTVVTDASKAAPGLHRAQPRHGHRPVRGHLHGLGVQPELQRFSQDVANFGTALSNS